VSCVLDVARSCVCAYLRVVVCMCLFACGRVYVLICVWSCVHTQGLETPVLTMYVCILAPVEKKEKPKSKIWDAGGFGANSLWEDYNKGVSRDLIVGITGVLQCVAVCCSVLQCGSICCSVLQRVADATGCSGCNVLQCVLRATK